MALDAKTRKALRKRLPKGFIQLTLDKLKKGGVEVTHAVLSQNLSGAGYNKTVIEALIAVANEYQADLKDIQRRARGVKA